MKCLKLESIHHAEHFMLPPTDLFKFLYDWGFDFKYNSAAVSITIYHHVTGQETELPIKGWVVIEPPIVQNGFVVLTDDEFQKRFSVIED